MLTSSLLRTRREKGILRPAYVDPSSPRHLERARLLLEVLARAADEGSTRGEVERAIREQVIGDSLDLRLSNGLCRTCLQACEFGVRAPLPPEELRARLFETRPATRRALFEGRPSASERIAHLGADLGCEPEAVRRGLYADLDENHVLLRGPDLDPTGALHRYNLHLVQGLLLHALSVRVRLDAPTPARARQVFRCARFHQLMYRIHAREGSYVLELDGPLSLLKLSTRYGLRLALFFPVLPLQPGTWTVEADLRLQHARGTLHVSSEDGLRSQQPDSGTWRFPEEEAFEERFRKVVPEWTLERGGELQNLGGEAILVPDYTFTREGKRAFLEIIGIWRRDYLERRLALLARHGRRNLILAVSRNLVGDDARLEGFKGTLLSYAKAIPPDEVRRILEEVAE
jgi:hypothetical protein